MRSAVLASLALVLLAGTASADLNVVYKGTDRFSGKDVPAEARYSVAKGRVAAVMKGSTSGRIIFLQKEGLLRFVDDSGKTVFDMDPASLDQLQSMGQSAHAQMDQAFAQLPPEQRKMAEEMMKKTQSAAGEAESAAREFVPTGVKKTIGGYECTQVEVMRGKEKRAEYWATRSPDFHVTPEEFATMKAMHEQMAKFMGAIGSMVGIGGSASAMSGFDWGTPPEGYPVVTRCFDGDRITLDLQVQSVNHDPVGEDPFRIPEGYKKQNMSGRHK